MKRTVITDYFQSDVANRTKRGSYLRERGYSQSLTSHTQTQTDRRTWDLSRTEDFVWFILRGALLSVLYEKRVVLAFVRPFSNVIHCLFYFLLEWEGSFRFFYDGLTPEEVRAFSFFGCLFCEMSNLLISLIVLNNQTEFDFCGNVSS